MEQISGGSVRDRFPPLSTKYPWLVAQNLEDEEHDTQDQLFCTIHDELPHYRCRIPELFKKRIRGCFHGWVILSNHPHNIKWSLWNPLTSKIICLPALILKDRNYESIGQCCLSAPPDDPSSIILLTRTNKSTFVFCRLDSKRKKFRWTETSYAYQLTRLTNDGKLVHSLTCCNGKVYGLSTDGSFAHIVICPLPSSGDCGVDTISYLKGSATELFYIDISFEKETPKTPAGVYFFKADMTCIDWEEREYLKTWDLTDFTGDGVEYDDLKDWEMSCKIWEEMDDLKDAIFFVDLARDQSISYSRVIAGELGGYIHICNEMGETIYSYQCEGEYNLPKF